MRNHEVLPRFYPLLITGSVFGAIAVDYLTGPGIQFPILYLLPIGLASWFSWFRWGCALALTMPWMRLVFDVIQPEVWSGPELLLNALIRMLVFSLFVYLVNRTVLQHQALQHEVRTLRGLLHICSFCKKIRNNADKWTNLEQYLSEHSEARFSHSLCPDCLRQHYPNYYHSMGSS